MHIKDGNKPKIAVDLFIQNYIQGTFFVNVYKIIHNVLKINIK